MLVAVGERAAVFVPVPKEGDVAAVEVIARGGHGAVGLLAAAVGRAKVRVDGLTPGVILAVRSGRAAAPRAAAVDFNVLNRRRVQRLLFNVRKQNEQTGETFPGSDVAVFSQQDLVTGARKEVVSVVERLTGKAELLDVIRALHAAGRFARSLDGGQKEPDQDTDNRDNDEQFDKGEPRTVRVLHVCIPHKVKKNEMKLKRVFVCSDKKNSLKEFQTVLSLKNIKACRCSR